MKCMKPKSKNWIVSYTHCHGDLAYYPGLTLHQAKEKIKELKKTKSCLDFAEILYNPKILSVKVN
jgi:hypothetical protein